MACLCGHAKVRHDPEADGRCRAMGRKAGMLCFCVAFTSELENERQVRLQ